MAGDKKSLDQRFGWSAPIPTQERDRGGINGQLVAGLSGAGLSPADFSAVFLVFFSGTVLAEIFRSPDSFRFVFLNEAICFSAMSFFTAGFLDETGVLLSISTGSGGVGF